MKTLIALPLLVFLFFSGCIVSRAEELETTPEAYRALEDYLSEDVRDLLPDGMFSEKTEEAVSAAEALTRPQYLFRVLLDAVGLRVPEVLTLLGGLVGILLLSAVLHKLRDSFSGNLGEGTALIFRLCLFALILGKALDMVGQVKVHLNRLSVLMTGLIPLMGAMYVMGGNVATAVASESILVLFLNICEYITASVTPAVCGICLSFSILEVFGGSLHSGLSVLSDTVKRWYVFLLGLVVFLLSVSLSGQAILAVGTDTLGMKGLKYAIGQMIPVVGGGISSTLTTVASGVSILRGALGVSGVILVGLTLLPALVQLLLFRACFRLSSGIAAMLGCDGEKRLMEEISSLYGYMAAAVSICSVICVLALAIFTRTTAAI